MEPETNQPAIEGATSTLSPVQQQSTTTVPTIEPESNQPAAVSTMPPALYKAAKLGDVSYLQSSAESHPQLHSFLTPQRNTILHIAARFGQTDFASAILDIQPDLLRQRNYKGDTSLHIAARWGYLSLIELLIRHCKAPQHNDVESGRQVSVSISGLINLEGNTVLHEAIQNRNVKVALRLLRWDPTLLETLNNLLESPLYLAVDLGSLGLTRNVIREALRHGVSNSVFQGPNGMTALHAAALKGRPGYAIYLIKGFPSIITRRDSFGRTALHYSVSCPSAEITTMLLEADHSLAYVRDVDGLTPLLVATSLGHQHMVDLLLEHSPDCGELCDSNGQNVYHLIMREKLLVSSKYMYHPDLKDLLNDRDDNGNTPLHVAVKSGYPRGTLRSIRYKGVNLRARNNEGFTALDLTEKHPPSNVYEGAWETTKDIYTWLILTCFYIYTSTCSFPLRGSL